MDKYKIFVYGSPETKQVLQEIKNVLGLSINELDNSDNPNYIYGCCPLDNRYIWYASVSTCPNYFSDRGYQVVTPQEFRDAWLGKDLTKDIIVEPKTFCCKGCEKLREVCQKLAEEKFIDPSETNFKQISSVNFHFFKVDHKIYYYSSGDSKGEIVSPEEFYKRIAGKPWEEKKKIECLGFIGGPDVEIDLLPMKIKNPSEDFLYLSKEKPFKINL